jgi:hypothetical protein
MRGRQSLGDGVGPKPHSIPGIVDTGIDINHFDGDAMKLAAAFDPKRTFQLFSRHPPWCIFVGADLAPNDLDVTAQIIQLVGKG